MELQRIDRLQAVGADEVTSFYRYIEAVSSGAAWNPNCSRLAEIHDKYE
jgi:hypothetical protein